MKTKVLVSTAIVFSICCSTAMAQWPHNTYANDTGWEVEFGTRILDRPGTENNISLVTTVPTNVTVFTGNDASKLGTAAGADFRFLKRTCYEGSWELRGFYNQWDNFQSRTGNLRAPLFTPPLLPAQSRPDRFDYFYESRLFSLELNYKKSIKPGVTWMCGPRYVSLEENVNIDSNFITPLVPAFAFNLASITTTENVMPGIGIGLEFRRPIVRELFFIGSIKGTALANFVSTNTTTTGTVIGGPPVSATIFDDSTTEFAGIGELSARLHYDISPGTISMYAGYEAMWLDGVALAPGQLLTTVAPPAFLNNKTTAFAHGLALGALIRY